MFEGTEGYTIRLRPSPLPSWVHPSPTIHPRQAWDQLDVRRAHDHGLISFSRMEFFFF